MSKTLNDVIDEINLYEYDQANIYFMGQLIIGFVPDINNPLPRLLLNGKVTKFNCYENSDGKRCVDINF